VKYTVERGVPIPNTAHGNKLQPLSFSGQLRSLKKGQSILVPDKTQERVAATGAVVCKKTGQKYTTRLVDGGVRIWRVS